MRPGIPSLLSAALLLVPFAAHADTFLFTATGAGVSVEATLTGTADPNTAGAFDLTGGTGVWNGMPVTLYTPSGTSTAFQTVSFTAPPFTFDSTYEYDNVVYPTGNGGVLLDEYGLLFSSATDHLNVYSAGNNYVYTDDEIVLDLDAPLTSVTLVDVPGLAVTPEPSSFALLGTGLLGVAGVVRRRLA